MLKKAITILLTSVLLFLLIACNSSSVYYDNRDTEHDKRCEITMIPTIYTDECIVAAIERASENMQRIAINYNHNFFIKTDNSLWGGYWAAPWIDEDAEHGKPMHIRDDVVAVSAHGHVAAFLKTDNSLWFWRQSSQQEEVIHLLDDVVSISSNGRDWLYAEKTNGEFYVWRLSDLGFLDDNLPNIRAVRVPYDGGAVSFYSNEHTMRLQPDGGLWGWGSNRYGELGIGDAVMTGNQVHIMDNAVAVFAETGNTFAIRTDGTLWGCAY